MMEDQIKSLNELLKTQEPLDYRLEECLCDSGFLGQCIKHPLVFSVPHTEQMNAYCNAQLKQKLEMLKEYEEKKEWSGYIFCHERPYRFEAFFKLAMNRADDIPDEQYWKLLASCWIDTENMWQVEPYVRALVTSHRPKKECFMDEEDHKFFDKLPDEFLIYRGHQKPNRNGVSWTLSYWRAKWFAQRFEHKGVGKVSYARCKKEDVIGFLGGRGEYEVAILPEKLEIKSVRKQRRSKELDSLWKEVQENSSLTASPHGPWHWEKVEKTALALAKAVPGADQKVCQIFAILHDSKRENDSVCKKHGPLAAKYVEKLCEEGRLDLKPIQKDKLMAACEGHTNGETTEDPTIGVCWDADRLDLLRVGVTPDPKYFSTDAAKSMIWKI
jgi:hypothetical protein